MAHTLIASPDEILAETVRQCLVADGHTVSKTRTLSEARSVVFRSALGLCFVDTVFHRDEVCSFREWLRSNPSSAHLPLVLLAPRATAVAGALLPFTVDSTREGVVSKPLHFEPLRREIERLLCDSGNSQASPILKLGSLALNSNTREVADANGGSAILTPTEFRLLHYLMEHPGETRSTSELLERVWGYPPGTAGPEIVRAHVRNLRDKLKRCGLDNSLIRTLPGFGYSIAP